MNAYELNHMIDNIRGWCNSNRCDNKFEIYFNMNENILMFYYDMDLYRYNLFENVSLSNFKKLLSIAKREKWERIIKFEIKW